MKRYLIIARTYYQLILSIQLRLTLFNGDDVVLLVSDDSSNADVISYRLSNMELFDQVCYIKTKGVVLNRTSMQRLKDFFDISFRKSNSYACYLSKINNKRFDEVICYNYGIDILGIYSIVSEYNRKVKVSLFEEGVLSYDVRFTNNWRRRAIGAIRRIRRRKAISDAFDKFYCFYPDLYKGNLRAKKVPLISSNGQCAEILRNAFGIKIDTLSYPRKYIYFTSVYDFEGGEPIGEYQLVKEIANLVGNENLLVKVHPRDTSDRYKKSGFEVDVNSSVPWEIIQLSSDFSNNVFLTATSGSVLAGSFMSEEAVRTFYLYKKCNIQGNLLARATVKAIEDLLSDGCVKEALNRVEIVDGMDQIIN